MESELCCGAVVLFCDQFEAQHHFFHLSEFLKSTPLHYFQTRFRPGIVESYIMDQLSRFLPVPVA